MKWNLLLLVLLGGCSGPAVVLFGLTYFAVVAHEDERDFGGSSRTVPELDPTRRVIEVDCTQPIDYSAGNIRCK